MPTALAAAAIVTTTQQNSEQARSRANARVAAGWGKRLGVAAFLFFLIKGLAWLIVPAVIAVWATS